jgi:putative FmdB family regulatory protein
VPFYDYVCQACGRRIEVMHGVHATGPERCDACGGRMQRVISRPAIHFKGSGWAKMDARASSASGGRSHESSGAGGDAANSEDTPAADGASKDETPAKAATTEAGPEGAKPAKTGRSSGARSRSRDEA